MRIHILGAPGAGVTTLGRQLAEHLNIPHFDTDDYHWFTDDPLPYRRRRNPDHRRKLLSADLEAHNSWVLSGSLCGWGDCYIPLFDRVIWLWLPADVRVARIHERERVRYGPDRIAPGGDLHSVFEKFIAWAAAYDEPTGNVRSREAELEWLERLACPVFRYEEPVDVEIYKLLRNLLPIAEFES
jgi:adenylate kinase family enzyme